MANEKNLIPINDRAKSVQRKIRSKGGKAKAEKTRQKKLLKECMLDLLSMPVTNTKEWNKLSKMGIDPEEIDNRALLTAALFRKAVEYGDVAAFKEIRNLIGEETGDCDGELNRLIEGLKRE